MIEPVPVTSEVAPQVAAFTRVACPYDLLSTASVERGLFHEPDDPSITLASYDGGLEAIGSAVVRGDHGWVKFLAVHPRSHRRGVGSSLLRQIELFCRNNGAKTVEVGGSAPYYVVPGVDVRATEAICFFQQRGYRRAGDAVNQSVRLQYLPEPILACHDASTADYSRILPWLTEYYPNWIAEVSRAIDLGTCVVHNDLGFACYDVNREGWFGPMATRPDIETKGVGTATLLAALHRMRARGYETADIAWSGPLLFYLKTVNARINRVFWWFKKDLSV